jgi:hypothetical protein
MVGVVGTSERVRIFQGNAALRLFLSFFIFIFINPAADEDEDEDEENEEERLSPMARITRTEEDEAVAPVTRGRCTPTTVRAAGRPYLIPSCIRVIRAIGNGRLIRSSSRESAASG